MTEPHYADDCVTLYNGDCLEVLRSDVLGYDHRLGYAAPLIPDNSIDAVVTDPPYGLEFMGKDWDAPWKPSGAVIHDPATERGGFQDGNGGNPYSRSRIEYGRGGAASVGFQQWCELWTAECLRVLKPGGHMLAFGGTRTFHRLACAAEDAGFEIRDSIAWLYGSGFPKSLDVSKAIDKRRDWALVGKLADAIRTARSRSSLSLREVGEAVQVASNGAHGGWYHRGGHMFFETGRSLPSRAEWTHLRSVLPIPAEFDSMYEEAEREVVAERRTDDRRRDGTVIGLGHSGNADVTAPATDDARTWEGWGTALKPAFEPVVVARKPLAGTVAANVLTHGTGALNIDGCRVAGDVPTTTRGANQFGSINDDGWEPSQTGERIEPHASGRWPANVVLDESQAVELDQQSGDLSSGSRRAGAYGLMGYMGADVTDMPAVEGDTGGASRFFYIAKAAQRERVRLNGVAHPTVKPLALMQWLVRLVTPPDGVVLEPFAGSGTTVEACLVEGFRCVAIEREVEYLPLILKRCDRSSDTLPGMGLL